MQIEEQVRHHPRIQLEEGRKESPARKSLHCEGQIKPGKLRKMFVFQQATSQDLAVSTTQAKNNLYEINVDRLGFPERLSTKEKICSAFNQGH